MDPQPLLLPAVEAVLSIALMALAAATLVTASGNSRLGIAARTGTPFAVGSLALRDLGGLDAQGRPIRFPNRKDGDRFVTFVIRAKSVGADCAYWNSVALRLADESPQKRIRLAAFCDSAACARTASTLASFPVIAFAENAVLLKAQRLDRSGDMLEVDAGGRALWTFRWRGTPAAIATLRLEALP